jgi:hypothetical protein
MNIQKENTDVHSLICSLFKMEIYGPYMIVSGDGNDLF